MTTTDRLRPEIDRDFSGDKIAVQDSAAAPHGADAEAAGTPLAPNVTGMHRDDRLAFAGAQGDAEGSFTVRNVVIAGAGLGALLAALSVFAMS